MSKSVAEYLNHIGDEIRFLRQASEGVVVSEFIRNEVLKRAFVRSLEIIGEATNAGTLPATQTRLLARK